MKKFLLSLLVTLSCAGVFAQQRPVVAVAPFEVVSGISQADANTLTGVFYNRLFNANIVTLVDRSIVERVIREHDFQVGDWSNLQKTAEFGNALNADWIVRGEIARLGPNIIVNVQFFDINTFEYKGVTDISLANVNEAYEKMTPLVDRLVQTIRANPNSAVSLYNQLVNATGTFTITVTQNAELPQETVISRTSAITLRGDTSGRTVLGNGSSRIKIERGVTLILENITLRGVSIDVNAGGTLIMNNAATITGCTGRGVLVNGGTFTMSGGTISGNNSGGVFVYNSGTFTMRGGTISGNSASDGGGVYVSDGTFTMSGGTIAGNRASRTGGGVYVSGTFRMTGGTIYGSNGGSNANMAGGIGDIIVGKGHAVWDSERFFRTLLFYAQDLTISRYN